MHKRHAPKEMFMTREHFHVLSVMKKSELRTRLNSTHIDRVRRVHLNKQCTNTMMMYIKDEHKCLMCPKTTTIQVSLAHHINRTHKSNKDKCNSCGQEFENREPLIEHIVHNHTGSRITGNRRGGFFFFTTYDC